MHVRLIMTCLLLFASAGETHAQKRRNVSTVEAALSEFAISGEQVQGLEGQRADILLADGTRLSDATLTSITTKRSDARVALFKIKVDGKRRSYTASKVYSLSVNGRPYKVNFLPNSKSAALIDVRKRRAAITKRLEKIRRKFWEPSTRQEQAEQVKKHKEFLKTVAKHFAPRLKMQLTETKYFLVLSDMPRQQIGAVLRQLDAMNEQLGQAFGFEPGFNIWKGKAVIVAFASQVHFMEFETKVLKNEDASTAYQGYCHYYTSGRVVVGCYRGNSMKEFSKVLVHETAHGYTYRFRTNVKLPSWLNEGVADWIAAVTVPASKSVSTRQRDAAKRLRTFGTLGGTFFDSTKIEIWQYGAASSIVHLLITRDPIRFKLFITGIKEGLPWERSLRRAYNASVKELCGLYGRSIGVPNLRP